MAYKQAQNRKRRLLKTYRKTKNKYGAGVWFNPNKNRYIRFTACNTSGYPKYLRKLGNKKVRAAANVSNFSVYKKLYDYKWTLY